MNWTPVPELHNDARRVGDEPMVIETPAAQWAYAASFALPEFDRPVDLEVLVDLEVSQGEVGVGLLNLDESCFYVERNAGTIDGRSTVRLRLTPDEPSRVLVLRNVGALGQMAVARVHGLRLYIDAEIGEGRSNRRVEVSANLFNRFRVFSGNVPAGYWVNWLGVKTRAHVWPFPPHIAALYARDRYETKEYPLGDEHVLDWVPLLEAVVAAQTTFRVVGLGAGWGRWLTAGAFAARQLGKAFDLIGVEAEPDHFLWMEQHIRDNALPADSYRLIRAAASAATTPCWFPVEKPDWYGQSIVENVSVADADSSAEEVVVNGTRLRRVQGLPIDAIVTGGQVVDYLHMDIQGTEFDFLSHDPDRLQRWVRMVNVGTHSELIERRLRMLFGRLGWESRYDIPGNSEVDVVLDGVTTATVTFGDGVQVWANRALENTGG